MSVQGPVRLAVRCRACGAEATHAVGALLFDPDADREADPGAAVYVPVSLTCPGCGAVDAFEPTARSVAEVARRAEAEPPPGEPPVVQLGRAALSDGTPIRTPSEGLALLQAHAEARPDDAARWRRLGNFAVRADRHDEAMAAFRRGAAIEGELECALAVAIHEVAQGGDAEGGDAEGGDAEGGDAAFDALARALSRLPGADPTRRPIQAAQLAEALRRHRGQSPGGVLAVEPVGALEVDAVRDWSRLGELLAARAVRALTLTRASDAPRVSVREALARLPR